MTDTISYREKARAILRAAEYKPTFAVTTVICSVIAAGFEGIGMGFILPIVELARNDVNPSSAGGELQLFADVYVQLGVPFTLNYVIVGVAGVMIARYSMSFTVDWARGAIETYYTTHLQQQAFEHAIAAEVQYFDREGSDDILNTIVTQAEYAGRSLRRVIQTIEQSLLSLMYFSIALYIAPLLTVGTLVAFGLITYLFQFALESGFSLGGRIADANERIQEFAQAGTQGIRDVKLFGLQGELLGRFGKSIDQFRTARVRKFRNESALRNFHQLMTSIAVFTLIYVALTFFSLSLGKLGVFLFAMFRLGPRVSNMSNLLYQVDAELPHLVRTQEFTDELRDNSEPAGETQSVPARVESVTFDDVTFSYNPDEDRALDGLSFSIEENELVAFVGPSGAGKSTIVSLLARLYGPDTGAILANGVPIDRFDVSEWRSKVSVVRQDPHIFNDTLRRNVTVGMRQATDSELRRACEIARVTEFVDDLPRGYDTVMGDDGVRLSGGQRQRVAIARALLKPADLIILDEATSNLDSNLEEQVHEAIESMERDFTILVIAHRLSTVVNSDRIYTMDDGEVVEAGTHEELVERGGEYADLYDTQTQAPAR